MSRKILACSVVVAFVAAAAPVQASDVTFLGMGLKKNVSIKVNGNSMNVAAGQILIEVDDVDFTSYCVDVDNWIKNTWTASTAPVDYVNGGRAVAWLYDHYALGLTTDVEAAGLQVAIWELLKDFGGALDVGSGDFKLVGSGSVKSQAETYLSALPGDLSGYDTSSYIIKSGDSPRSQHLIVPEPGTVALLAGMLPIALAWRRR